jgi:hypothetical protein
VTRAAHYAHSQMSRLLDQPSTYIVTKRFSSTTLNMTNQTEPQSGYHPVECTMIQNTKKSNFLTAHSRRKTRRIVEHWSNVHSPISKEIADNIQAVAPLLRVPVIIMTAPDEEVSAVHLTPRCWSLLEKEIEKKRDDKIRKNKELSLDCSKLLESYKKEIEELIRVKEELELSEEIFRLLGDKLATFRVCETKFDPERKKLWVNAVSGALWLRGSGSEGKRVNSGFELEKEAMLNQQSKNIIRFLQKFEKEYRKLEDWHGSPHDRKSDRELMRMKIEWKEKFLNLLRQENRRYYEVSYFNERTWAEMHLLVST